MTKHTILFLAANPSQSDRLALDQEARSIQVELERCRWRDRFEFVTRWAAEPVDVIRELRRLRPTVVHFSGHGGADGITDRGRDVGCRDVGPIVSPEAAACPGLCFHGSDGSPRVVSAAALRDAFGAEGASVKLVVLSACYSDAAARALLAHVDCVVGVAGAIRDGAAKSFAVGFYGGLAERASVTAAYNGGCAAIGMEGTREGDRPRLHARGAVDPAAVVLADLTPNTPGLLVRTARIRKMALRGLSGAALISTGFAILYRSSIGYAPTRSAMATLFVLCCLLFFSLAKVAALVGRIRR